MEAEVLGVAWDGTGYGPDGMIWGGEFLLATQRDFQRIAHLRPFPLPGGELAIRQPRYAALGLLHEAGIPIGETALAAAFTSEELAVAQTQLGRSLNTPLTTSAGRLFDAVAALLGIRWSNEFEAQAAIELEFAACGDPTPKPCPMPLAEDGTLDWEPMIRALLADPAETGPAAARFLETMSNVVVEVARFAEKPTVALSGGCFQNVRLLETAVARIREAGFTPLWPRRVPPNDGGLALGQAAVAAAQLS